ncbi:hypothetical protein CM15mP35_09970 [bacterium]|nr:MAG: hypothetical protein CM15mP35_09970 [bacterium]
MKTTTKMKPQANKLEYYLVNKHQDLRRQGIVILKKVTVLNIVLSIYPLISIRKPSFNSILCSPHEVYSSKSTSLEKSSIKTSPS